MTVTPQNKLLAAALGEPQNAHYAALGRFVSMYALAEAGAHVAARKLSGMSDEAARVVFAGMRLPDISERIRKLLALSALDETRAADIDRCLAQISVLSGARSKLAHRLIKIVDESTISVSNEQIAKSVADAESHVFSLDQLKHMEYDAWRISMFLPAAADPAADTYDAPKLLDILRAPWLYKPPEQGRKNKSPNAVPRRQKRQPPSSTA
jgi:hypothetical protein